MKSKILNFLLIISSLSGYLEWSGDSHLFLFQAEGEILSKLFTDPISVLHPFTILPMLGQVLLIVTFFQKKPGKSLIYISIGGIGILLGFMFVIGLMGLNYKIVISTIPFFIVAVFSVRHYRRLNGEAPNDRKADR
jgi:uncharacterized protein YacL